MAKSKKSLYNTAFTAFHRVRDGFGKYILDYLENEKFISNAKDIREIIDSENNDSKLINSVEHLLDKNQINELENLKLQNKKAVLETIIELHRLCDLFFNVKTYINDEVHDDDDNIIIIRDARDAYTEITDKKKKLVILLEQRIKFFLSDREIIKKLLNVRKIIATIHLYAKGSEISDKNIKNNIVIECDVEINHNVKREKMTEKNLWITKDLLDETPALILSCCYVIAPHIGKYYNVRYSDIKNNLNLLYQYYAQDGNLLLFNLIGSQYERKIHKKFIKASDAINLDSDKRFVITTAESWGYGSDSFDIEMVLQCFANLALNDVAFWRQQAIFQNLESEGFFEFIKNGNIATESAKRIFSILYNHANDDSVVLNEFFFLLKNAYMVRVLSAKMRDKELINFTSDDDEFHFVSYLVLFVNYFRSYLKKLNIDSKLYLVLTHYGDSGRLRSIISWCSFVSINEYNGYDIYSKLFADNKDKVIDDLYASFLVSRHIQFLYGGELGLLPHMECMALNNISGISNKVKHDHIPRFSRGSFIAFLTLFILSWIITKDFAPLTMILILLSIIFGIHTFHYPIQSVRYVNDGRTDFDINNIKRTLKFANSVGIKSVGLERRLKLLERVTLYPHDDLADFEPNLKF